MIFNLFSDYTIEAQSCLVVVSFSLFKRHGELTDRFTYAVSNETWRFCCVMGAAGSISLRCLSS